jgi:hypothetical protein
MRGLFHLGYFALHPVKLHNQGFEPIGLRFHGEGPDELDAGGFRVPAVCARGSVRVPEGAGNGLAVNADLATPGIAPLEKVSATCFHASLPFNARNIRGDDPESKHIPLFFEEKPVSRLPDTVS